MPTNQIERNEDGRSSIITFNLKIKNDETSEKTIGVAGAELSTAIQDEYKILAPKRYLTEKEKEAWEDGIDTAIQTAIGMLNTGLTQILQNPHHTTWTTNIQIGFKMIDEWKDLDGDFVGTNHFQLYPSWSFTHVEIDGSVLDVTEFIALKSDMKHSTLLSIEYRDGECVNYDTIIWRKTNLFKASNKRLNVTEDENGMDSASA